MGFIYGGSTARSKQCLNFKQYNIICWILETCGLADLQSFFFLLKKLLRRRFLKASSLAGWTFVFACLQLQPGTSIFHPSTQTNTSCCFKGGYLVLPEQSVSLVVPVRGSLSCQADLRWQSCGLPSYSGRGVLCETL